MRLHCKAKFPLSKSLYIGLILLALLYVCKWTGMIINLTPSMPIGLYMKSSGHIHQGDIVAVCLPKPWKSLGLKRGYLLKGDQCQGSAPLIKSVLATPQDSVRLTEDRIQVNGISKRFDSVDVDLHGRPLYRYPKIKEGDGSGYWLIGGGSLQSWDSRYWGPMPVKQIYTKLRPLLVWS